MKFTQSIVISKDRFDAIERMSPEEFADRYYAKKLSAYSDEEIVEEFNRRLKSKAFHNIAINCEAVVTK